MLSLRLLLPLHPHHFLSPSSHRLLLSWHPASHLTVSSVFSSLPSPPDPLCPPLCFYLSATTFLSSLPFISLHPISFTFPPEPDNLCTLSIFSCCGLWKHLKLQLIKTLDLHYSDGKGSLLRFVCAFVCVCLPSHAGYWQKHHSRDLCFSTYLIFIQVTSVRVTVFGLVCRNPHSLHPIFETHYFIFHTDTHPPIHTLTPTHAQKTLCRCAEGR